MRVTTQEAPGRERVRQLWKKGLTPRQIAMALGISTQAVYKHLARIRQEEEGGTAA